MRLSFALALTVVPVLYASGTDPEAFLQQWCRSCHQGKAAAGGFDVGKLDGHKWSSAVLRVRNGEMPPKGAPAPVLNLRDSFVSSVENRMRAEACAGGTVPGQAPIRRLNREEYAATVRDLLGINFDVGQVLPADGAGGEGFDNAAETLFLSPMHAEKYLEVAKLALGFANTDTRARSKLFIAKPDAVKTEDGAAREILASFLPRAFRRPVDPKDIDRYLELYRSARGKQEPFDRSVLFALSGVLISPQFLFRIEPKNTAGEARLVDDFSLASRLSYFLWGTMPDDLLWDLAEAGKLQQPEVLRAQVGRMMRNPRSNEFARRFVEQWLRTRDLGTDKAPDPVLFPAWAESEEIRSDIRYQPVLFFRELLAKDLSLLNLIDSRFTILNRTLAKLYDVPVQWRKDAARALYRVELPEGSNRGGLLGMPAVLAVSSYPNRTSPVLRGAWVLDAILGTPPPPPPPGVPPLGKENAAHPESMRARLMQHRENPVCAGCHDRIDPIGFALENYDALGFWRTEDGGKPIDSTGELTDGTKFTGPNELKAALLDRKQLFVRNLTSKALGYALGRGLTMQDSCTVDEIIASIEARDYRAQALIEEIVFSKPFRYQAGARSTSP